MTLAEFQRVMDHFQIWYNERIPLPSSEYGDAAGEILWREVD
jgi:hypothetical protein